MEHLQTKFECSTADLARAVERNCKIKRVVFNDAGDVSSAVNCLVAARKLLIVKAGECALSSDKQNAIVSLKMDNPRGDILRDESFFECVEVVQGMIFGPAVG